MQRWDSRSIEPVREVVELSDALTACWPTPAAFAGGALQVAFVRRPTWSTVLNLVPSGITCRYMVDLQLCIYTAVPIRIIDPDTTVITKKLVHVLKLVLEYLG